MFKHQRRAATVNHKKTSAFSVSRLASCLWVPTRGPLLSEKGFSPRAHFSRPRLRPCSIIFPFPLISSASPCSLCFCPQPRVRLPCSEKTSFSPVITFFLFSKLYTSEASLAFPTSTPSTPVKPPPGCLPPLGGVKIIL